MFQSFRKTKCIRSLLFQGNMHIPCFRSMYLFISYIAMLNCWYTDACELSQLLAQWSLNVSFFYASISYFWVVKITSRLIKRTCWPRYSFEWFCIWAYPFMGYMLLWALYPRPVQCGPCHPYRPGPREATKKRRGVSQKKKKQNRQASRRRGSGETAACRRGAALRRSFQGSHQFAAAPSWLRQGRPKCEYPRVLFVFFS